MLPPKQVWVVPVIDSNCGQYGHQSDEDTAFCNNQNFWGSDTSHVYRAVRVLARYHTRFPWAEFVSGRYGLDRAQEAREDVAAQRVVKALIVPT